jgi:hypothetical protein
MMDRLNFEAMCTSAAPSRRFFGGIAVASILALSASALAGVSNCCTGPGPGCDDPACEAAVCAIDPFCCDVAWDSICIGEAEDLCGDLCATGGSCPPAANDCCTTGGPGCSDVACCDIVCALDAFCCDTAWDSICVDEAVANCGIKCGSPCGGAANDCCTTGGPGCSDAACCETVCALDPFCCDTAWDGICVDEAIANCGIKCVGPACPPSNNDCCFASPDGTPGCSDVACCEAVCAADPFCCEVAWDTLCAGAVDGLCDLKCASICGQAANDCFSTGGPGCSDAECCEAVCAVDAFCCDVAWDGICVNQAFALCDAPACCNSRCPADLNYDGKVDGADAGLLLADWGSSTSCANIDGQGTVDGGDYGLLLASWGPCIGANFVLEGEPCGDDTNGGCNVPIKGDSNCCFANGGLGCDDKTCSATVCGVDPFCCDVAWDGICAGEALTLCPDICAQGVPSFGSIACGDKIVATAWADGNFRDTDWFEITFESATLITLTVQSQLPMVFGVIDTGGIPDCSLASAINPFAVTGFCGSASLEVCLPAGTWWLFAAPNGFSGFPCDSGNNQYFLELECGGECVAPACGNVKNDCFTESAAPFCSDEECCNAVCAIDPFCCDVAWDSICVGEAKSVCGGGSNCCFANGGLGCDDPACQDAVCAIDPFCCDTAWDSICAGEAANLCEVCGGGGSTCCFASGGLGCDDAVCTDCVCAQDAFCCHTSWDSLCAGAANPGGVCAGSCPCGG